MKRIAFLTSSRADYGIYLPLLRKLKKDKDFEIRIIAFGTHFSPFHGYTSDQIIKDGFEIAFKIESMLIGDSPNAISTATALTSLKFADFWRDHKSDFDLVFCLGDRYEMFAAVYAGIPFNIPFAHLHGGEKTSGAIDNIFRHAITLASKYHFVSCEEHGKRVAELTECDANIFNVGSLSLDNIDFYPVFSKVEFLEQFGVNLNTPTILVTVQPETIYPEKNETYVSEIVEALKELRQYQVIITLPNADTNGSVIRRYFTQLMEESGKRIFCIENLGSLYYFTAMKYCAFLMGNTSSGIIEAASFRKWVINLGDRQKGRQQSKNIINIPFKKELILKMVETIERNPEYTGSNIYYKENVAENISAILKSL